MAFSPTIRRYPLAAALCVLGLLIGCGGDLGSGGSTVVPGSNVAAIVVDGGPAAAVSGLNSAYVSVTVCAPGSTTNCQTIDHILLDTGSTGLRLLASVVNTSLSLPQESNLASQPLYECLNFADSYAWGSIRLADVQIADGKAMSLPVQLIGDTATPTTAPTDCSLALTTTPRAPADTVATLNANGVLGVGVFREDCGTGCTSAPGPGIAWQYYVCTTVCAGVTLDPSLQLQNPVYRFATNNNGVVIDLPAVGTSGSFGARGSLILGIATQTNNALGSATVLTVDGATGYLTTVYNGQTLANSVIDSASKGLYFDDVIPACPAATVATALYCPGSGAPLALSATIQSAGNVPKSVDFAVGDALTLLTAQPSYNAFANIAGPVNDATTFDWGLPFFYGRRVFVAIEGQATSGGPGPYFAF